MGSDWFRKTSWSIADQEDFYRRLARARESNRAQYAFIQGYTLMEQGAEYYAPALSLFDFAIDRYAYSFDLVRALCSKASCLERMGDVEGALAHYFRVIERTHAERTLQAWGD